MNRPNAISRPQYEWKTMQAIVRIRIFLRNDMLVIVSRFSILGCGLSLLLTKYIITRDITVTTPKAEIIVYGHHNLSSSATNGISMSSPSAVTFFLLRRKGSAIRGAIKAPNPNVKCKACMKGPLDLPHMCNSHTLPAASTPPPPKPITKSVAASWATDRFHGITAWHMDITAQNKAIVSWLSHFSYTSPPAIEPKR